MSGSWGWEWRFSFFFFSLLIYHRIAWRSDFVAGCLSFSKCTVGKNLAQLGPRIWRLAYHYLWSVLHHQGQSPAKVSQGRNDTGNSAAVMLLSLLPHCRASFCIFTALAFIFIHCREYLTAVAKPPKLPTMGGQLKEKHYSGSSSWGNQKVRTTWQTGS